MKVYEVLDDSEGIKTDVKHNKGKAVAALVRGAKRKANAGEEKFDVKKETNTVMG